MFTVKILDVLYQAAVYRFHLSTLEAAQFCQTKEKVNEWKQKRKHTDLFFSGIIISGLKDVQLELR